LDQRVKLALARWNAHADAATVWKSQVEGELSDHQSAMTGTRDQ
jgi:hypothetical protein